MVRVPTSARCPMPNSQADRLVNHFCWATTRFAGAVLVVLFFFLPETSHLALLRRKAHFIRTKTGVMSYQAASELKRQTNLGAAVKETFFRPFELLFLDPIVFLMSLYLVRDETICCLPIAATLTQRSFILTLNQGSAIRTSIPLPRWVSPR